MRFPLWIAAPIGLGITLMSTFAPDSIPPAYHVYGFYLGLLLVVFGVAGGGWQLWKNRIAKAPEQPRIPIKEFINQAEKSGWNLQTLEILDLGRAVRQAATDGILRLWGRQNINWVSSLRELQPLQEIPKEHWLKYELIMLDAMNAKQNADTKTHSYDLGAGGERGAFIDIHIDAKTAIPWLKRGAQEHKKAIRDQPDLYQECETSAHLEARCLMTDRPYYDKALAALDAAHRACFEHPDRPLLGMSHGPFSGVNVALGIVADLERQVAELRGELDKTNGR